jgi:hypothetical protein
MTTGKVPRPGRTCPVHSPGRRLLGSELDERLILTAQVLSLTSKCIRKVCQAKSACLTRILRTKQHISKQSAAIAAVRSVEVPIRAPNVVPRREAKGAGNAVNGLGGTLQLEKNAHWCFIQVHIEAGQAESRAVLLVAEAWAQTDGAQNAVPALGESNQCLPFELLLVPGAGACRGRGLRRDYRAAAPAPDRSGWSRSLCSYAQQAPSSAKVGIGSVVEDVPLENPAVRSGAQAAQLTDQAGYTRDAKFDFNFAGRPTANRHGTV